MEPPLAEEPGGSEKAPARTRASRLLAELEVDAGVGALLLPGVVHKLRNLVFAASARLDMLRDPARQKESLREARSALDEMRIYLDLCGADQGSGAAPRWLESGSTSIERVGACLGLPICERGLGFEVQVEPQLPGLAISPVKLFRWTAVALRRLLDAVPRGMCGTLWVKGGTSGEDSVVLTLEYRPAPGFLPMSAQLRSFEHEVVALARADGIGLATTPHPGPQITLRVPLRRVAAAAQNEESDARLA